MNYFEKLDAVRNHKTPVHSLEQLAKDEDPTVRYGVARNPNTPIYILEQLAKDEDWYVRSWVAGHPNTPDYIKKYFYFKLS